MTTAVTWNEVSEMIADAIHDAKLEIIADIQSEIREIEIDLRNLEDKVGELE